MQRNHTKLGGAFILLAMLILGFIDNFFVEISKDGGLWQFHVTRTLMALPMFWVVARLSGQSLRPKNLPMLAARSLVLSVGLLIYFGGLGFLPIAQVGAGLFTSPIWMLVFSMLFFGVRVGPWRVLAMALGFAGVLAILRPEASALSGLSLVPLLAGAFYALGMLATRYWCGPENALVLTAGLFVALGLWGGAGLIGFTFWPASGAEGEAGFVLRGWATPTPRFLFWSFVQAVGSLAAVILISRAYQLGEASFIAVFEYSFLIFAAFWAWVLWGQGVDLLGALGIAAIIFSGGVIALRGRDAVAGAAT